MSLSVNYLVFCVPTLHINNYRNRDIVLTTLITEFITLGVKHHMAGKVPKSKCLCLKPFILFCTSCFINIMSCLKPFVNGRIQLFLYCETGRVGSIFESQLTFA